MIGFSNSGNKVPIEVRRRDMIRDKERIADLLKAHGDKMPIKSVAKKLRISKNRPSLVSTEFPLTIAHWVEFHGKKKVFYVDLHPHIRQYHRKGMYGT